MISITVEGIDGSGKTTMIHGFNEEAEDGDNEYVPGLAQRLNTIPEVPKVQPSREPGSLTYTGDATPSWQKTPLMQVERSLNTVDFWIGMARYQSIALSEEPEPGTGVFAAQTALAAARFYHEHGVLSLPGQIKACLLNPEANKWPEEFGAELKEMEGRHADYYDFVSSGPTLRRRFETYNARDCIRHALLGARDSEDLASTASGLLFFAGHIFHGEWIGRRPLGDKGILISDRGAESQLAYGKARGDDPLVEELYEQHRGYTSDIVVYLYAPPETAMRRKDGSDNSDEEGGWEKKKTLQRIHEAYMDLQKSSGAKWIAVDGTQPPRDVIEEAFEKTKSQVEAEMISKELKAGLKEGIRESRS